MSSGYDGNREARGGLWNALNTIEQLERKMIIGIFKFTFYKCPNFIWSTIKSWLPNVVKLAKVWLFFCAWLCIVLFPVIYYIYTSGQAGYVAGWLSEKVRSAHSATESIKYIVNAAIYVYEFILQDHVAFILGWIALCLVGSFWGVLHITRTRFSRPIMLSIRQYLSALRFGARKNNAQSYGSH